MIPKNENLWVFGAWFGEKYADNSKYLFEYVNENRPEIRAVWLTKNKEAMKLIKEKGYEVYLKNSIKGYGLSFKAGTGILSNSINDVIPYTCGRMKIIQLWHGSPLKKIMMDNTKTHLFQNKLILNLFPFFKKDYTAKMYIAPSEEVKNRIVSAFRVTDQKVKITGYPRNDVFFLDKRGDTAIEN
ncbi:MAG: CDP-glycerol glycerophosphotransferase family protein [Methanobacterium paludis]|nr:CDP-glycerol glycerophosphotransferase family protein [Methanobacterium paludis]